VGNRSGNVPQAAFDLLFHSTPVTAVLDQTFAIWSHGRDNDCLFSLFAVHRVVTIDLITPQYLKGFYTLLDRVQTFNIYAFMYRTVVDIVTFMDHRELYIRTPLEAPVLNTRMVTVETFFLSTELVKNVEETSKFLRRSLAEVFKKLRSFLRKIEFTLNVARRHFDFFA
jgi:hypothetical protein